MKKTRTSATRVKSIVYKSKGNYKGNYYRYYSFYLNFLGIPTSILQLAANVIEKNISESINMSIRQCIFQINSKQLILSHVIKKMILQSRK